MSVSQLLGARARAAPKVYAYVGPTHYIYVQHIPTMQRLYLKYKPYCCLWCFRELVSLMVNCCQSC